MYVKPTNPLSYLLPISNHPDFIFDNIPKSLFIRIRRICSNYSDFLFHSRKLCINLIKRGYDPNKVFRLCKIVSNYNRDNLIRYKEKQNLFSINLKKNFLLSSKYDFNYPFFKKDSIDSFNNSTLSSNFKDKKLSITNSINNNIFSLLIHDFKINTSKKFFSKKCNLPNCNTCLFTFDTYFLKLTNNFILPIKSNSNCISSNIVYIIKCNLCNCYYIGESSKTAKIRISQHLYNIKSFQSNISKTLENFYKISAVSKHFNQKGHNIKDFSFHIFKSNLTENITRKSVETDLIHIFLKLNQSLINDKIPSINNISSLSFS